jgi:nucleotidyltransferase/DNA polymerase involved in DNA repair
LEAYGIRTCLDLADADGRLVKKLLTQTGYEIWQELNGTPVTPIRPKRPPHKVIARGGSLMGNAEDPAVLRAWAVRHAERLVGNSTTTTSRRASPPPPCSTGAAAPPPARLGARRRRLRG